MAANRQRTSSNAGENALKALHVLRQSGVGTVQAARLDAVSKSLARRGRGEGGGGLGYLRDEVAIDLVPGQVLEVGAVRVKNSKEERSFSGR